MRKFVQAVFIVFTSVTASGALGENQVAELYFISPADGEVVSNPVNVKFGLRGMGVAPAGVERDNTGHHHLLINVEQVPASGVGIPADENHVHFGGGQTETSLELPPGTHSLQLLLGDFAHRPHSPAVISERISITVTPTAD